MKNIIGVAMILVAITIGWMGNYAYEDFNNERMMNGLYIQTSGNYSHVKDIANERDGRGDWVCINVAYDMTPKEAYTTCVHECSHKAYTEIYAESCEAEPDKCLEWLNDNL